MIDARCLICLILIFSLSRVKYIMVEVALLKDMIL